METFEYMWAELTPPEVGAETAGGSGLKELNRLGRDGWEVTGLIPPPTVTGHGADPYRVFLKRATTVDLTTKAGREQAAGITSG